MTDIVKRLRVQHEHGISDLPEGHEFVSYGDSADEIERLTAQLAEKDREIERLRKSLRRIEAINNNSDRYHREIDEVIKATLMEDE